MQVLNSKNEIRERESHILKLNGYLYCKKVLVRFGPPGAYPKDILGMDTRLRDRRD